LEFLKEVKGPEGMSGNLNINAVSKKGAGEENLSESVLNNGTVKKIPVCFRPNSE